MKNQSLKKSFIFAIFIISLFGFGCTQQSFEKYQEESVLDNNVFNTSFSQKALEKKVDLLVVVDNSRSMRADQDKLSREFRSFVSQLSDADYRIAVTTTDTSSPGFENTPGYWGNLDLIVDTGKNYISKKDSNPEELFSYIINRPETASCDQSKGQQDCASFDERPLAAIKMAIDKREAINRGFFREDADLAILIISDEDETEFPDGSYFSAQDLVSHISSEFSDTKKTLGFVIAIRDQDQNCFDTQALDTVTGALAVSYGIRIGELADITGGFKVNICNENFGGDLKQISEFVKKELLPLKVKLPPTVEEDTIKVSIILPSGKPFDFKTEVKGGELRVTPTPPEDSEISISYEF